MTALKTQRKALYLQRKTLYLLPTAPRHAKVNADVTERLLIHAGLSRTMAIPVRHIQRIVANAQVDFSGQALRLCAIAGVAVALQVREEVYSYILPAAQREDEVPNLLTILIEEPLWAKSFAEWKDNQRAAFASRAAIACGFIPGPAIRRDPRGVLCNAHQRKFGDASTEWLDALTAVAHQGFMAQATQQYGLPRNPAFADRVYALYEELADIVTITAHIAVHYRDKVPPGIAPQGWAIYTYERHRAQWLEQGERLLKQFETLVRETAWTLA